jgi:hypothetical protein
MSDRAAELLALLREHGPEGVAELVADEMRGAPPADVTTTEDGVMQAYGARPCMEVVDD